jgi:hypothetical protein
MFGLVLLYDLVRRARVIDLLYTNDGLLSNHYLLFRPQDRPQLSLFMGFSSPFEMRLVFALLGILYLFYTVGLFTRVVQILVLVAFTSLNTRNLFFEDGGVATMVAVAMWTVFLPLGDRFSLDALRREAALPSIRARVRARKKLEAPVVSLAVLALTLQIVVIYWLNALHKTGPTWRSGEAVHYVLWQSRVNTWFAWWLAHHEPAWLSYVTSKGTLLVEYAIPILILYPYATWNRALSFLLAVVLHGGIALVMTLGPFSYAMIALVATRLPPSALTFVARRLPASVGRTFARARSRAVRKLTLYVPRIPIRRPPRQRLPWVKLREATVGFVIFAAAVELTQANPAIKLKIPQPDWLRQVVLYPRLLQRWTMFAPHAPTDDGYGVVDALTADGRRIDPFTGKEPDFEAMSRGPIPGPAEAVDYFFAVHWENNEPYRRELARYLDRWHELDDRGPDDRLVAYEVVWVSQDSPRPGSVTPGPQRREVILRSQRPLPKPPTAPKSPTAAKTKDAQGAEP